jgi:hypothetical protein
VPAAQTNISAFESSPESVESAIYGTVISTETSANTTQYLGFTNNAVGQLKAIEIQAAPSGAAGLLIGETGQYHVTAEFAPTGTTTNAVTVEVSRYDGTEHTLPNIGFTVAAGYTATSPIISRSGIHTLTFGNSLRIRTNGTNGQTLNGVLKLLVQRVS